jgi:hypothetical protein
MKQIDDLLNMTLTELIQREKDFKIKRLKNKDAVDLYCIGILSLSVCSRLSPEETVKRVNAIHPCGTTLGWVLSGDKTFKDGSPHPGSCEEKPQTHKHYYLIC